MAALSSEQRPCHQTVSSSACRSGPASWPARLNALGSSGCASVSLRPAQNQARLTCRAGGPVVAAGAIGAHVAHVIAAPGQEDRRVATESRGALDPRSDDRAKLPCRRLKRPVTVARDAKLLGGDDPAARIDDRRRQRPLCGSTPTTSPARSGVISVLDGPGPGRTCWR